MSIPRIDPSVKYRGASYLRELSVENMRQLDGVVVIHDPEAEPLIVIVPFSVYTHIQEFTQEKTSSPINGEFQDRSPKKPNKREAAIQERAASDVFANGAGRNDIDYSDLDSAPTVNVASLIGTAGRASSATKKTVENWRANRKPIPKHKDRPKG